MLVIVHYRDVDSCLQTVAISRTLQCCRRRVAGATVSRTLTTRPLLALSVDLQSCAPRLICRSGAAISRGQALQQKAPQLRQKSSHRIHVQIYGIPSKRSSSEAANAEFCYRHVVGLVLYSPLPTYSLCEGNSSLKAV